MTKPSNPLTLEALLATPDPPRLGPDPRPGTLPQTDIERHFPELFNGRNLPRPKEDLVRACLLLWHDHLDASHVLAQGVETQDGSYVHAIMHRREPDFANAKYWFHRVGDHPCFGSLAERAQPLLAKSGLETLRTPLLKGGQWNALAFVDLCKRFQNAEDSDPAKTVLRELQAAELRTLLAHLMSD